MVIENRIKISEIFSARRIDPSFYRSRAAIKGLVSLSSYVNVKGGKRIPKGETFTESETPFLYLRISDIGDYERLNYSNFKYISAELFRKLERYEIGENELAFSIAGTIGRVFIVNDIPLDKRVILTENCAKLIIKEKGAVLPEYLQIVLNLPLVQQQINSNRIQTTIPKIGLDRIGKLQIPAIPPIEVQRRIVDIYSKASDEKRAKEQQAQALLASIDPDLSKWLEITKYQSQDRGIFTIKISQLLGNTFDVKSNQKQFSKKGIFDETNLDKIATLNKGKSITKDNIKTGVYPVIAGGQSSPYSHSEYNQDENAITVSASGAYSGFVWYHDYNFFASDCTVVRSKNEETISTNFIYLILKFKQEEIYRMQRGSGQPHVYPSDLGKILIPTPPPAKQNEIVETINTIRAKASALQAEASAQIEKAKAQIEKIILEANDH